MDLKSMKQAAEREIFRYRDNRAYVQGVLDGCGDPDRLQFISRAKWAHAVDLARAHWERKDPLKAKFFLCYYRPDRPLKRYEQRPTVCALAMKLNVSVPTLYKWRSELLTTVVLAAIQTGALRPYGVSEEETEALPTLHES